MPRILIIGTVTTTLSDHIKLMAEAADVEVLCIDDIKDIPRLPEDRTYVLDEAWRLHPSANPSSTWLEDKIKENETALGDRMRETLREQLLVMSMKNPVPAVVLKKNPVSKEYKSKKQRRL